MRLSCLTLLLAIVGCATKSPVTAPGVVLFVPGATGDGPWHRHVVPALRQAGERRPIETVAWGRPGPGVLLNLHHPATHAAAERRVADAIARRDGPIDVIAHSAGGGVALGALGRLPEGVRIGRLVLLQPSVSPGYDLGPALARVERIDVFHSPGDAALLRWRTGTFGTYDGVRTAAAGHRGFDTADPRVAQHAHDGGHFDVLARAFLRDRVAPLIVRREGAAGPTRSAAARRP